MDKTQEALGLLEASQMYLWNAYSRVPGLLKEHQKVLADAQAELSELLRLHSVVKEFIAENDIVHPNEIHRCNHENIYSFIESLCDIVGYKE